MKSKDQQLLEQAYQSIFLKEEYGHTDLGDETERLDQERRDADPNNEKAFAALDSLYAYWRAYNPTLDGSYFRSSVVNMEDERLISVYDDWNNQH